MIGLSIIQPTGAGAGPSEAVSDLLATIPSHILYYTCVELDARGISLARSAEWHAMAPSIRSMQRPRVTFAQAQSLILEAIRLTGDRDLGLSVGLRQSIASTGPLASAILASATHFDALRLGVHYHRLTGSMLDLHLLPCEDDMVALVARSRFPDSSILRFLVQELFGNVSRISQFLYRADNPIRRVEVMFEGDDRKRFHSAFGCPVEFAAAQNRVLFGAKAMNTPLETADPFARANIMPLLDGLIEQERSRQTLLDHVDFLVSQQLSELPSISQIASELKMSERSLRRKLGEAGSSYRAVTNRARQNRAMELIRDSRLSMTQIAEQLGFEDARSLRRNVVRWFGKTPTEVRNGAAIGVSSDPGHVTSG